MRIEMPEDKQDNPTLHLGEVYAPEIVAAAFNYSHTCFQHSKLSLREYDGARMRTAEINGCNLCQNWRSARDVPDMFAMTRGDATKSVAFHGPAPDEEFYRSVSLWRTSPIFSPREKVAIELAERMALEPQVIAADDAFWTKARAVFSDNDLVDLVYCIGNWIGTGRAMVMLGIDGVCQLRPAQAA